MKCENAYCCSNSNEVIDFDEGGLGGPPDPGGAGALRFLLDLGGPVNVLMSGDVGLSPGVTHPDSSELMLLSPALYKLILIFVQGTIFAFFFCVQILNRYFKSTR